MVAPQGEVLVFEVGGRRFGLPAVEVREIVRAVAITVLPGAPPTVEGVINVRGEMVPVIDLRHVLGLAPQAVALSDQLVILRIDAAPLALRVDRALDLRTENGGGERRIVRLEDGLVPVLEPRDFLTPEHRSALRAWLGPEGEA